MAVTESPAFLNFPVTTPAKGAQITESASCCSAIFRPARA